MEHTDYDSIEQELNDALAVSLDPRGPDVLFDVIAGLGLGAGADAIDVGCGRGRYAMELAHRFSFAVLAIDPQPRYEEQGGDATQAGAPSVTYRAGVAEAIAAPSGSADLVLYREVLYLVADLEAVFRECSRVLKPSGRAVVYQLFNTPWLEPVESARFWGAIAPARNATVEYFEQAAASAGLIVEQLLDLRSETVEWAEEHNGKAARELLAAARLLRKRQQYVEQFGEEACEIKLNDALWFVFRMIGKLTQRIYVLRPT